VKQAQSFSDYVSKNVIPNIQMVDVAAYKSKFEQAIIELSNSEQNFYQELKKYDDQMNQVVAKFQNTHANQCASLKADFQVLNDHLKSIVSVKIDLISTLKIFHDQTSGMKTISSCSNQWPLVATADQSLSTSQTKLNVIQKDIQKTVGRIDATIKNLK
jgi:vacuolar-type H+-ATPase subunit D/Vma8